MCWRINVTSHSVVNGHTAVHHLNQSSQPSQATTTTRSSTPIPDTAARKCLPRRKREREHIKSASIILWWAADSLSQISQSLHCTVYCHRVLTLSTFNWNGERGDYPIYSGAQRFLMCLNTGSNWGQYMGVSQGIIGVYRDHSERIIKKKYNGKNCGSYFHEYSQSRNVCTKSKERDENEKKKKSRLWCFSLRGDWALHSVGSPVWSAFHSAPSKVFQCRMLHHTAWSTTHFSAYLYPFKSRDLTNPYAKPSRHTNWLMNNRRKDAARLLRENKRRWTSCLEDFSEMDLDQSSTGSWHSRQKKKRKERKN